MTTAIRVSLPYHLQNLARVGPEISVEVDGPVTVESILDAVEAQYPMLCGTIRDHATRRRRPFLRYFCCQKDISHDPVNLPLPDLILNGTEPLIVWGALSGG